MWIEQWLDLIGYEITLKKIRFKSLSKWRSRLYEANVKQETVPDCRAFLRKSFWLWSAHEAWSCQKMSEADEKVCIYAVILTDTWDHFQKVNNDTDMRPCTKSYMILGANEGNREQVWCGVAYSIE